MKNAGNRRWCARECRWTASSSAASSGERLPRGARGGKSSSIHNKPGSCASYEAAGAGKRIASPRLLEPIPILQNLHLFCFGELEDELEEKEEPCGDERATGAARRGAAATREETRGGQETLRSSHRSAWTRPKTRKEREPEEEETTKGGLFAWSLKTRLLNGFSATLPRKVKKTLATKAATSEKTRRRVRGRKTGAKGRKGLQTPRDIHFFVFLLFPFLVLSLLVARSVFSLAFSCLSSRSPLAFSLEKARLWAQSTSSASASAFHNHTREADFPAETSSAPGTFLERNIHSVRSLHKGDCGDRMLH